MNGTIYDIQVGGQCPAVIKGIPEDKIHLFKCIVNLSIVILQTVVLSL